MCLTLTGIVCLLIASQSIVSTEATECTDAYCAMQEQMLSGLSRFNLPRVFFPNINIPPPYISIWSHVSVSYPNNSAICTSNNPKMLDAESSLIKNNSIINKTWYWTHTWARSPLLKLLGNGNLYLHISASNFLTLVMLLVNQVNIQSSQTSCSHFCIVFNANLLIGCTPSSEEDVRHLWESVIQWSKASALSLAAQDLQPEASDIGYVYHFSDGWPNLDNVSYKEVHDAIYDLLVASLLSTQVMLNLTAAFILMWLVPSYVLKWSTPNPKHGKLPVLSNPRTVAVRLYWSFFLLGGVTVITVTFAEIIRYVWLKASIKYQIINVCTTLSVITVELVFAVVASKNISNLYIPKPYAVIGSILCFDFITKRQLHYRAIVATSLWFTMAFIQHCASSVIPVIILLMVNFIRTLSTLAILFSVFLFLLVLTAAIAHNIHLLKQRQKSYLHVIVEIVAVFVLVGCMFSALAVFWVLTREGFSANSVSDILWSLGLPAVLSGGAVYIKQAFLREVEEDVTAAQEEMLVVENGQTANGTGSVDYQKTVYIQSISIDVEG